MKNRLLSLSIPAIYCLYLMAFPIFIAVNKGRTGEYLSNHLNMYIGVAVIMLQVIRQKRWVISIVGFLSGYKIIVGLSNAPYGMTEFNVLYFVVHALVGAMAGIYVLKEKKKGLSPFGDLPIKKQTESNKAGDDNSE